MSRRNYRRINKQPKLKNNQILKKQFDFTASSGNFQSEVTLITNPDNISGPNSIATYTGYVETIGRFSIDCTLEGISTLNNVAMFVMYIPEGYSITSSQDILQQHPEWIMAYKYLGSPTDSSSSSIGQGCQPTRIRSRVRRNLMTGDRIILLVTGTNSASQPSSGTIWAYLKFASRIN